MQRYLAALDSLLPAACQIRVEDEDGGGLIELRRGGDDSDGEEEGSGKVAPGRFIPRFIKWIKWQKEVRQEAYTCLFPWLGFTLPPPPSFVPFSLSSGPSPAKGRAPVTAATR